MKTFALCLLSLLIMQGHGTLQVRISSNKIAKERENTSPFQGNIESQLNVTKKEIKNIISDTVNPFLDSSRPCGGSGWTRVAYLNMTDPRSVCPTNWTLHTSPVRGCGQTQTPSYTFDSSFFSQLAARAIPGCVEEFWPTRQDLLMHFMPQILLETLPMWMECQ